MLLCHGNGVRRCRLRFRREICWKEYATKLTSPVEAFTSPTDQSSVLEHRLA